MNFNLRRSVEIWDANFHEKSCDANLTGSHFSKCCSFVFGEMAPISNLASCKAVSETIVATH